jgi:glycosyltransferase involved in cell wall biosynthesis
MKVALVHDFLLKLGGAERVLQSLAEMFSSAPIYTLLYDREKCGGTFGPERVRTSFLQNSLLKCRPRLLTHRMPQAIEEFDFSKYDLVISSSNAYAHGIITSTKTKHLCYCHSPMRYAWDWTHQYLDEQGMGKVKTFLARRLIHQLRLWDRVAADRPDLYIANSENTRQRLRKYYQVDAKVVHPPVHIDRFEVSEEKEDFFLIVSALSGFKKIDRAVEAFNRLGLPLKVVGDGAELGRLTRLAGPTVKVLGRKTDREIADLMQGCRAFVFPGEEDFGIAPVEAMACGKPVIALGRGGLLESVTRETGVFFSEPNEEGLMKGVGEFVAREKGFDSGVIRNRAEAFSEEKFRAKMRRIVDDFMTQQ